MLLIQTTFYEDHGFLFLKPEIFIKFFTIVFLLLSFLL